MQLQKFGEVAQRQQGILTRRQALELASEDQIEGLLRRGHIEKLRRGVYRMPGSPNTWLQRLAGVVLAHHTYVVSHYSAARLWQLGNHWNHDVLEVSTNQRSRHSLTDVIVHKAPLPPHHVTFVEGLRITTVARTLVDLAATCPAASIERAFDHVLSRRIIQMKDVTDVLDEIARPGRPRISVAERIVAQRQEHQTHSALERMMLQWIRRDGMALPVSQFAVLTRHCSYDFDFAYPESKVAIECDGYTFHSARTQFDNDARRSSTLAALGWRILRVTTRTKQADFLANLRIALCAVA